MMVNLPCLMVSCTNFLRPTCSYTECPLSFLTGSCLAERTTAGCSSCLYLDFTDLFIPQDTDIPRTLTPPHFAALCDDAVPVCSTPSLSGFFPEPCPVSESSATRQGSGINDAPDCLMPQPLPSFPDVWCPLASSSDHRRFHFPESCRWFSEACRLWQSMTAFFSEDYLPVLYSTYGMVMSA